MNKVTSVFLGPLCILIMVDQHFQVYQEIRAFLGFKVCQERKASLVPPVFLAPLGCQRL